MDSKNVSSNGENAVASNIIPVDFSFLDIIKIGLNFFLKLYFIFKKSMIDWQTQFHFIFFISLIVVEWIKISLDIDLSNKTQFFL
jgi:hypothetical protein